MHALHAETYALSHAQKPPTPQIKLHSCKNTRPLSAQLTPQSLRSTRAAGLVIQPSAMGYLRVLLPLLLAALPYIGLDTSGAGWCEHPQCLRLPPATIDYVELFTGEGAVSAGLRLHGLDGRSFDQRRSCNHNFMTKSCFLAVLVAVLQVKRHGLLWAAPPYSTPLGSS